MATSRLHDLRAPRDHLHHPREELSRASERWLIAPRELVADVQRGLVRPGALLTYLALQSFEEIPHAATFAKAMGMTSRCVRIHVAALERAGWMHRSQSGGRRTWTLLGRRARRGR